MRSDLYDSIYVLALLKLFLEMASHLQKDILSIYRLCFNPLHLQFWVGRKVQGKDKFALFMVKISTCICIILLVVVHRLVCRWGSWLFICLWFVAEGCPEEYKVLTCCDLVSFNVAKRYVLAAMASNEFDSLCVVLQLVIRGNHSNFFHFGQVKLHGCVRVVITQPARQKSAVNLLQFNNEQAINVLMDY